jgi:Raf kinase inhibitor-like YbhB/YbcL family protein
MARGGKRKGEGEESMQISGAMKQVGTQFENPRRGGMIAFAVAGALMLCASAGGGGGATMKDAKPTMELTSPGIRNGEVQKKFTCDGADVSPELSWSAPPAGTKSFALLVIDPDAPVGEFVHWVLYDLPAEKRGLPEGVPKEKELADGSRQGKNDFDNFGYGGPCPPGHSAHRYIFSLYALDTKLSLPAGATRMQVEQALKGHILARGELTGRYHR